MHKIANKLHPVRNFFPLKKKRGTHHVQTPKSRPFSNVHFSWCQSVSTLVGTRKVSVTNLNVKPCPAPLTSPFNLKSFLTLLTRKPGNIQPGINQRSILLILPPAPPPPAQPRLQKFINQSPRRRRKKNGYGGGDLPSIYLVLNFTGIWMLFPGKS